MHIELNEVTKCFGRTCALDCVSLNVPPSSIVAVLGENGAGKSTLLRLLAGVCVPDRGTILLDSEVFQREKIALRRRMLYTPEVPLLFPETVAKNVAMFSGIYGVELTKRQDDLRHWLVDTGAAPLINRQPAELSRGQVWKAAMACAAAVQPELWLVDEPFASGMDAMGLGAFRRLARHLADHGGTVIYTTQMVELAADFSDHVCVLRHGALALWQTGQEVKKLIGESATGAEDVLRGLRQDPGL